MEIVKTVLYLLCSVTSLACTVLLIRGYRRRRFRLLLWSAACFACLTVNNVLLFVDLITLPDVDLRILRLSAALAGILCMLYGFIWEAE